MPKNAMRVLGALLMLTVIFALVGCVSSGSEVNGADPVGITPSTDDTHGWGANIQSAGTGR